MSFTFVTPQVTLARNAGALYNYGLGNELMASLASSSDINGLLNSVYMSSVGNAATSQVAKTLVANLGITGDGVAGAEAYVVAQLNPVAAAGRGKVINDILMAFSSLTGDATYGAAATAWNAKVANAVAYAAMAGSKDTTFAAAVPPTVEAPSFMLTADAPSVNEGGTSIFSLKTTGVDGGSEYTYLISGVGPEDLAGNALSGTVKVGADGLAIIPVSLTKDQTTEGAETLTLTVAGKSASVTVNDTSTDTGKSVRLTTAVDAAAGGSGNDTFDASLSGTTATLNSSDSVTGGAGDDALIGLLTGGATVPNMSGVESITLGAFGAASTLNLLNSSGYTTLENAGSTADLTYSNIASAATKVKLTNLNGDTNTTLSFPTAVATPLALGTGTLDITLNNVTRTSTATITPGTPGVGPSLTATAGNMKITSTGSANTITNLLNGYLSNLTIAGDKDMTFNSGALDLASAPMTVDASALTGRLSVSVANFPAGAPVTISGGSANDTITGGAGNDVINGLGGNDTITISAGNDNVNAGDGTDTISVGANLTAADTIVGGAGNDTLQSTAAIAVGQAAKVSEVEIVRITDAGIVQDMDAFGTNAIFRVRLDGSGAHVVTNAPAAVTELQALGYTSTTTGTTASDVTFARKALSTTDALTVTYGENKTTAATLTSLTVNDEETLTFKTSAYGPDTSTLLYPARTITTLSAASATKIVGANSMPLTITNASAAKLVEVDASAAADDFVMGVGFTATLSATLKGGAGNDVLRGGGGNDSLEGGAANDTLFGGAGNDVLSGGDGNDSLDGGADNDTIAGGAGNDTILPGAGVDSIDAGEGDDTITVVAGDIGATDVIAGGNGTDAVSLSGGVTVTAANVARFSSIERINVSGSTANSVTLSDAAVLANGAVPTIRNALNGTGALTVDASLLSAANGVTVDSRGSTGNDVLTGGAGNDTFIYYGSGSKQGLTSGDAITGGSGTDTIRLNADLDSTGAATMGGAVTAVLGTSVSGVEQVTVLSSAGNTSITTNDANLAANETMTVDASAMIGSAYTFTFDGSAEQTATARYIVTSGAGPSTMTGGAGADSLVGGSSGDNLSGGAGNDSLVGNGGNDTLIGGLGSDNLSGGAGNDIIIGGPGADALNGGEGNDTFVYTTSSDSNATNATSFAGDTITGFDFGSKADVIQLGGAIGQVGTVTVASADLATLLTDLSASAALNSILAGTSGLDVALVTVNNGTAAGTYLVADATASATTFGSGTTVIRMVDPANVTSFGTATFSSAAASSTLASTYSGTTLTVTGAASGPVVVSAATSAPTITDNGATVTTTGTYSKTAVTAINLASVNGGLGASVTIDGGGTENAALAQVTGTSGDDTFTLASADFGAAGSTISGGNGSDTIVFTTYGTDTVGDTGAGISSIENIRLTAGATSLTLDNGVTSVVAITNTSATATSTVVLGAGAAHTFTSGSTGADKVSLGLTGQSATFTDADTDHEIVTAVAGSSVTASAAGGNTIIATVPASLRANYTGGAGTDVISLTTAATGATVAAGTFTSIETLNLGAPGTTALDVTLPSTTTSLRTLTGDATSVSITVRMSAAQLDALTTITNANLTNPFTLATTDATAVSVDFTGTGAATFTTPALLTGFDFSASAANQVKVTIGADHTSTATTFTAGTNTADTITVNAALNTSTTSLQTSAFEVVNFTAAQTASQAVTITSSAAMTVTAVGGTFVLPASTATNFSATGTASTVANVVTGGTAGDSITGGPGADTIKNQPVQAGSARSSAADVLTGGAGIDTFYLYGDVASSGSTAISTLLGNATRIADFARGTDIIELGGSSKLNYNNAATNLESGSSVAGNASTVMQDVTKDAAAAALQSGGDILKLTTAVATTANMTLQQAFNAAIGTATVTGLGAGKEIFFLMFDSTNAKMLIGLVDSGTNTTVETGDVVTLIGSVDMTAADYTLITAASVGTGG